MYDSSQNNVSQDFSEGKLCTLYLNSTSCVPDDVSFDENGTFNGAGWKFSSSRWKHQRWNWPVSESV